VVDFDLLKKLIDVLKKEEISGLSVEEKGVKYEIKRELGGVVSHVPAQPVVHHVPAGAAKVESHKHEEPKEDENLMAITSPMVGTFYATPSPDSPAFVKVGDHITAGKVVCIIEAMKLFNEIESEVSGTIVKILAEHGKPVEYGQKLMLVKKG